MITFVVRRLLQMIVVLFVVTILVFLVVRLLPGDPILLYLSRGEQQGITQEKIDYLRHDWGLDRPMVVQYADWLSQVFRGDLGNSIATRSPVTKDIKARLPVTLHLGILAFIISILIGVPLGVITAVKRGTWLDSILTSLGNMGICIPTFWIGILLIYFFGLKMNLLPIIGYTSPFTNFWDSTRHLIMPVFCLAIAPMASLLRLTRSSMLEITKQDYIRTAWAKGLKERQVIIGHALKNSLIPVVSLAGVLFASIIGGSVFVETVFSIPGMGRLAVEALFTQDYSMIQGIMLIIGIFAVSINFIVDLSYGWLDPRVRNG
jgi:peptide/nickel transport system permease protein